MKKNIAVSSHPHSDYSSDSSFEDYYLCDEEDRKLDKFADRWLVDACEEGRIPWDSDPERIANFLKEINEEFGWGIPIDMDNIKKKLRKTDNRIKKMSKLYLKQHNSSPTAEDQNCKKNSLERRNCSTSSSLSTLGTSTSFSPRTTLTSDDTMKIDENPVQETVVGDDQENPAAVAVLENQEPPKSNYIIIEAAIIRRWREASVLFIKRRLYKSDLADDQNRLSMPCSQVNDSILTREEMEKLHKKLRVAAKLIDPSARQYDVNLRLLQAGPTTCSYAIGSPWRRIKEENKFRRGMELDVRGCRGDRGELCFLLEIVD